MFVLNLKLSVKKIIIACLSISLLSAMTIEYFANKKLESASEAMSNDSKYDFTLTDENYLNILKTVHENIDENVGKTIKITGFVFRMPDFDENTFVCGKNIIYNNEESVDGFMCNSPDAKTLLDNEWIQITGIVEKGTYVTDMPIIKVGSIKKVKAPENTFIQSNE